jgi:hypothetical protein
VAAREGNSDGCDCYDPPVRKTTDGDQQESQRACCLAAG